MLYLTLIPSLEKLYIWLNSIENRIGKPNSNFSSGGLCPLQINTLGKEMNPPLPTGQVKNNSLLLVPCNPINLSWRGGGYYQVTHIASTNMYTMKYPTIC